MPNLAEFDFATLRQANTARLPQFRNSKGDPAHSEPDGSDWALSTWSNATLSELGEVAEALMAIKTLEPNASPRALAHEISDVIIYLDIYAMRCGVLLAPPSDGAMARLRYVTDSEGKLLTGIGQEFWLTCALWQLGIAGNLIKKVERGDIALNIAKGYLARPFSRTLGYLQLLAESESISLCAAIVEKFNIVSARVGSDVFINEGGSGLRYQG